MYLILLLVVFILTGVFSVQNVGTHDFTLLGYSWTLPLWAPTAIGVAIVSVLLLLHMSYAGLGSRFREMGYGRELDDHRGRIDGLVAENARLREELAAARGEVRGAATAARPPRPTWLDGVRERFRNRTTTAS